MSNTPAPLGYLLLVDFAIALTIDIFRKKNLEVREGCLVISRIKNMYHTQLIPINLFILFTSQV